jgi:hypothetical protein
MTPAELESAWNQLNADYLKLGSEQWSIFAKDLSSAVWATFQHDDIYDNNLISAVARAIVFWDDEQKFYGIKRLWQASVNSEDVRKQNQLCSIIWAIMPYFDKNRVKIALHGVNRLDRKKSYGEHMAMLIREMDYI